MIVQSLVTAFAFAFLATAALGHVLLLQAAFAPSNNPKSGKPRNDRQVGRQSPVRGSRRSVGNAWRATGSMVEARFTRSRSSLMRRTSFTAQ